MNTGDIKAIRGEGMPMRKNPQQRGNLYIEFQVVFPPPEQLTPNIRKVCTNPLPLLAPLYGSQLVHSCVRSCCVKCCRRLHWTP